MAETGIRVSFKTHAPLSLSGTLSTTGHWDQSSVAMCLPFFYCSFFLARIGGVTWKRRELAHFVAGIAGHRLNLRAANFAALCAAFVVVGGVR